MRRHKKPIKYISPIDITPFMLGNKESEEYFLILAHKDLDGLLSAFLLGTMLKYRYKRIDILLTTPHFAISTADFLLSKNRVDKYKHVALVDLSVNYNSPNSSYNLVSDLKSKIKFIIDHHHGWLRYLTRENFQVIEEPIPLEDLLAKGKKAIVNPGFTSCARLIYEHFNMIALEDQYINDLTMLAEIADDLIIRGELEGTSIHSSFLVIKNNKLAENMKLITSCSSLAEIESKSNSHLYNRKKDYTIDYMKNMKEIHPKVVYISVIKDDNVNYTILAEEAYKRNYEAIIIKEINTREMKIGYVISHKIPELDLIKLFGLGSGSPRRITIFRKALTPEIILDKMHPYLEKKVTV